MKLTQQASQLKWNAVVLYMSFKVHMSPRLEERMDIILQFPFSRVVFLVIARPTFPRQQVDDINHHSQGTFQALH